MWWRHAGVHRARFRELVAGEDLLAELVPEVLRLACPRCGDWYVADLDPEVPEPWDLEGQEWAALQVLGRLCSDHVHSFQVSDDA